MIDLAKYKGDCREKLVLDKYGWDTLDRAIFRAKIAFFVSIHNQFLGNVPDNSDIDIDDILVDTVLNYIYDNDEQLHYYDEE